MVATPDVAVQKPRYRLGVDSGGTFTDVCLFEEATGRISIWKVASTPRDPSEGIAAGVAEILSRNEARGADVVYLGHGTTVGTNALIEGRGARTALLTTRGFRDVLEIRRQKRASLYDLQVEKPAILASRDLRREVSERVLFDGSVLVPLDEDDVRAAARLIRESGAAAVAISYLFSFLHPAHEKRTREILREECPDLFVSASHEIAPEFREFERTSTVVVNAYLGPIMQRYLQRLRPRLEAIGVVAPPHLTQSNGGVISAETAGMESVRTILSGPAAGVTGALAVGAQTGAENLITFDMGGTSTDVALIHGGRPQMANNAEVHGHPLKVQMLNIHTVGAGGGSIAREDAGLLKVGPASAGADPGPACYGRGNEEPTVTDANVVLGILNATHLLKGRLPIDAEAARRAVARLAERLGIGTTEAAQGILRVVAANMVKAIRVISIERGHDPRDFTLMAFGGAGPLHSGQLARELGVPRVIVPRFPGVMCALGLLLTDLRTDLSLSRLTALDKHSLPALLDGFGELDAQAAGWFDRERIDPSRRQIRRAVDMRYRGQGHELTVPWPETSDPDALLALLRGNFEHEHRRLYGYVAPEEPIHVTTLRIEAIGQVKKVTLERHAPAAGPAEEAIAEHRDSWLPGAAAARPCPVYDRDLLGPGHRIAGPALIEQLDTTTVVLEGQTATVDPFLNILIEA